MKKNKIGLITTHDTNNYGAILQTFALYHFLSKFRKIEIINYDNHHISDSMRVLRFEASLIGILRLVKDLLRLFPRFSVIKKIRKFQNEFFLMTKKVNKDNIKDLNLGDFGYLISGSDQIWNPACMTSNESIDETYFLNFAENITKISYASSLGSYIFSDIEQKTVRKNLIDFKHISVREEDAKIQLEKFINRRIDHVLDPTLLLSQKDWVDLFKLKKSKNRGKYILLYSVPHTKLLKNICSHFSSELNLPIYSINQNPFSSIKVNKHIKNSGPKEFLDLFFNAEFVITDSFHGVCFSTNFNKNFIVAKPEGLSNRIESLLKSVGLNDRMINSSEEIGKTENIINFERANALLLNLRKNSKSFLHKAIDINRV